MPDQTQDQIKTVNYWKEQIKNGLAYRKKYGRSDDWGKYKKYYRGDWSEQIVPVNRMFAFCRSMIPNTYFRKPTIVVTPKRPEFEWHARVVEQIDNHLINETNLKYQLKRAILDAFYGGVGPIKLGYDSEFGFDSTQVINNDGETITNRGQDTGEKIEYNTNIKEGMPWAMSVPPEDIITPWGYRDAETMPWIAHCLVRPVKDIHEDQKYNKQMRTKIKGGYQADINGDSEKWKKAGENTSNGYAKLYEIRNAKQELVQVLCEDKLLLSAEDGLQIEGFNYEFIQFNPDPEYFWGIPDARMLEPQQKELNEIRTQASKHRRLALIKFLYAKGTFTGNNLDKLLGEHLGPGIEVNSDNIEGVIKILQPHIPPDLYREAMETNQDSRETMGFSRNQGGEFAGRSTPPSAREASIVQASSETRSDERRDIVADVLVNILRKWNQYIFKYWDKEKVVKILGPDGAPHWISYTGKELVGEYNVSLDPDSGLPITRGLRHQQAERLFMNLRGDEYIDQTQLRKLYLESFEWIDPTWGMIVKPSPEELAMIQQQKMQGQNRSSGMPKSDPKSPIPLQKLGGK